MFSFVCKHRLTISPLRELVLRLGLGEIRYTKFSTFGYYKIFYFRKQLLLFAREGVKVYKCTRHYTSTRTS